MKKITIIWLLGIIIVTGYITWAKSYTRLKNTVPHVRALLEMRKLLDAGSDAEADALLDRRLIYMSENLRGENIRLPFPPKEGLQLADEIDDYMAKQTEQATP